ncbi:hypothetical protein CAPTEDRAFT_89148 [Capitella teleta]|uniref:Dynein heavy chain ATP-binding dynein motor region domain-containing protein n=1 Tax=Capitella teleta TaxID=283909 RepID=X2BAQ4_CAPTE|nr:hypothetical protein CAPTEDRAFT_89148 [Capitella teleta]|eukprot:ELT90080.1 hypothetical protein CAPTEDRAFT_89148 [Capitella teleta]
MTENFLTKIDVDKEKRAELEKQRREAETELMENRIVEAQKDYEIWRKKVLNCAAELEKRITEHDTAAIQCGMVKPEITLQVIHDAEADLEIAKMHMEESRNTLCAIKLQLRQQQAAGEELAGLKVTVKELDDVLLRDVGNVIRECGKWPLIIDPSAQAATFLRYRDTNYLQALNPREMEAEKVRMALVGAIRFGKPLVLDMMEVDMFDTVSARMDEIYPGLMADIMDKSIMKEEKYIKLLKQEDGVDYDKNRFNDARTQNFKFFIITKNPSPPDDLVDLSYLIRIHIPTA